MLHQALVELNDWVEDGCPNHPAFIVCRAICSNIHRYFMLRGEGYQGCGKRLEALSAMFVTEGLDFCYPFNDDAGSFSEEVADGLGWENPRRLAWLKQHGQRTISDCTPFTMPLACTPDYLLLVNLYDRNGQPHALRNIWLLRKNDIA